MSKKIFLFLVNTEKWMCAEPRATPISWINFNLFFEITFLDYLSSRTEIGVGCCSASCTEFPVLWTVSARDFDSTWLCGCIMINDYNINQISFYLGQNTVIHIMTNTVEANCCTAMEALSCISTRATHLSKESIKSFFGSSSTEQWTSIECEINRVP